MAIKILGIETSCDETAAGVVVDGRTLLSNVISSQADLHSKYGGVVPEVASRQHIHDLVPVLEQAAADAGMGLDDMDAIAVTYGPGLAGSLITGVNAAKAIAYSLGIPLIGVNHLEGHIYASWLAQGDLADDPGFPLACLVASGGHTDLLLMEGHGRYTLVGRSRDDAAGEAFDKTASLLGLPYPGGPQLAALAQRGDAGRFRFPRPMTDRPGLDFSFSGLKTAVMLVVRKATDDGTIDASRADIAASFQRAAVDTLVGRALQAAKSEDLDRIVVAGGVGANRVLREDMVERFDGEVFYPRLAFCTDNGAMIAVAGALRLADANGAAEICAQARWSLETLAPPGTATSDNHKE